MRVLALSAVCIAAVISSCNNADKSTTVASTNQRTVFFDTAGMDATVKPGDNFFEYANGKWMKLTKIPDDQSGWGSFYTLYDESQKNLRELLDAAAKSNGAKGSLEQKLGDYYLSSMDTAAIDKLGMEPLKPMLAKIDALKDYKEMMNLAAESATGGVGDFVNFYVGADEKNSSMNILVFNQAGLSLPDKDYYFNKDSANTAARTAFLAYAKKLFELTGTDSATAAKSAATVLALETDLAKSHRTPVELRDPQSNYNKLAVADLDKNEPNIGWKNVFDKMHIKADSINVAQPGYYVALNGLLASKPFADWKTKLKYDYISANASLLSKDFTKAKFEFGKIFSGLKTDRDRWKKMVSRVDGDAGELLGQLYVKKYFTEAAKKRMDELVNNLQKAFEVRIKNLDWMSDSTKQRALVKLNTFLKKIGYPDKWKNYDDVSIDKAGFYANAKSFEKHNLKEQLDKIGKPVDRTEWGMTPPTINAYYNPTNNEIVFPAGILQFPFFDVNADDAINYGAIGMVIGHEMTHGFDDQGSQYDEKGNMQNWWTKSDGEKFKAKTGVVVKQYNAFTVLDGMHVNGALTLGENIADIGGLAIAYDAFKMTKQGKDTTKTDGFTPDQRFFLGYAQVWRLVNRDETMRVRVTTDPHSPEMYRVNGPLMSFEPFYTAFGVKEGDKMYLKPEDRAKIW
ncbi:MAG: M13 family metallopeptidase [Ferruginibacter sp.]